MKKRGHDRILGGQGREAHPRPGEQDAKGVRANRMLRKNLGRPQAKAGAKAKAEPKVPPKIETTPGEKRKR